MRITISGTPGSGKTTIAKKLASILGYRYYSVGELKRNIARLLGITIDELNKKENIDRIVDAFISRLVSRDNLVIDGRMAPILVKKSIKIWLYTNPDIAEKRIKRVILKIKSRKTVNDRYNEDIERFKQLYGVDLRDVRYDLSIDTTDLLVEEVLEKILKHLKHYGIEKYLNMINNHN